MKIENPSRTENNLVICKNCHVFFYMTNDVVFEKISNDCLGHEFSIPIDAEIYEINNPAYFIRKIK